MTKNAENYLKKPDPKKWAELTSEEQRYVERLGKAPKKSKSAKVDAGGEK